MNGLAKALPSANMGYVKSFRELDAYKLAGQLSSEIFQLSREFPREEKYSLTDQIRRSARSIGAQIAEAWGKRRYEKSFVSKLCDADGELQETEHWIETAADCSYISQETANELIHQYNTIGKMLNGMIAKSSYFCSQ